MYATYRSMLLILFGDVEMNPEPVPCMSDENVEKVLKAIS